MPSSEHAYLMRRAREERRKGSTSENNAVALAHLNMAEEYERRALAGAPQTREMQG